MPSGLSRKAKKQLSYRGAGSRAVDHMRPYMDPATLFEQKMSAQELIDRVNRFPWRESLLALADLAAMVARDPTGLNVQSSLVDALLVTIRPEFRHRVLASRSELFLAHEQVLSFLAHTVVLYGGESDGEIDWARRPRPPDLALWLLGGNGFIDAWSESDSRPLSKHEELIASLAHQYRFNNKPDLLAELARVYWMLSQTPLRNRFRDPELWRQLQEEAFGCSFSEYFESQLGPMAMLSQRWGDLEDPDRELPMISKTKLYSETALTADKTERSLLDLSVSRGDVQSEVRARLRSDGLPHAPTALYHRPLVRLDDARMVVPLPWAFHTQLRTGPWAQLLGAAKKLHGSSSGADMWLATFGDLVERWCQFLATEAGKGRLRGAVILPRQSGDVDEIEDVVILEKKTAILFSVKSRLVKEPVARHAVSRSGLLDWYDAFFFGAAKGGFRNGVVPLLSAQVDELRAGRFENDIPPDVHIIPVLVTYDALCEEEFLYRRIAERTKEGGWLQQRRVAPLVLARVAEFELLMRHASDGLYLGSFFRKRKGQWKNRRLDQMIHHELSTSEPRRLPAVEAIYTRLWQQMFARLFPGTPIPRSVADDLD